MISDIIGGAARTANEAIADDARDTVADLQELLVGPRRPTRRAADR